MYSLPTDPDQLKLSLQCTHSCPEKHVSSQAQSEVAQLQTQLQAAASQQEELHEALHEMQATIALLRDQIQRQATTSAHASAAADSDRPQHGATDQGHEVSCSNATGELVQALQQQVADLKAISSFLDDSQQQQQQHLLSKPVLRSVSLGRQYVGSSISPSPGRGSMSYGAAAQKHECMMPPPPPRSLPSRRLPMSAYASPASGSRPPQTDAIKAHHPLRHSASASGAAAGAASGSDKCWCGRPKKASGSGVSTPVRWGGAIAQEVAHQWDTQQQGHVPHSSSNPLRDSGR